MEESKKQEQKLTAWASYTGVLLPVNWSQRDSGAAFVLRVATKSILIDSGRVADRMHRLEGCEVKVMGIQKNPSKEDVHLIPVFFRPIRYTEKWNSVLPAGISTVGGLASGLNCAA